MASPLILEATPSKADRLLKATQQRKYVKDLWILLGSILAFLTVIRVLRLLYSLMFSAKRINASADPATPSTPSEKVDPEALNKTGNGKASFRRLSAAFLSAFRVVAFRLNIPVGPGAKMNVAESLFVFGYIAIMLVLCFIDSEYLQSCTRSKSYNTHHRIFSREQRRASTSTSGKTGQRILRRASCLLLLRWLARTTSFHVSSVTTSTSSIEY